MATEISHLKFQREIKKAKNINVELEKEGTRRELTAC